MAVSTSELLQKLKEKEKGGRITCTEARKVAEELGISYREVGKVCNKLKIKIVACELGCF
jgi:LAO/AO transport system kinase